jgi:6-phosphogluconolactonase
MTVDVRIVADAPALHRAAAAEITTALATAVHERGQASLVLSGGSTPRGVYAELAAVSGGPSRIPWEGVHVFWGDERHVPPDHPESNFRMADEALLAHVPIPRAHVHRIAAELADPALAAARYAQEICDVVGPVAGLPRFDVVLLGLGADGHVASLFPGSPALAPDAALVAAPFVDAVKAHRITMTLPLLNAARVVIGLVSGAAKARAVRDVLQPPEGAPVLPGRLVRPLDGRLVWLLDRDAARLLVDPAS